MTAPTAACNGDIANKIGTYEKAVVAKENGIPFYVAAPFSTIDFNCDSGARFLSRNEQPKRCLRYGVAVCRSRVR